MMTTPRNQLNDCIDFINMSPEEFIQIIQHNAIPGKTGVKKGLKKEEVFDILSSPLSNVQIAEKYGVTDSAIIQIRKGRNYRQYVTEYKAKTKLA